ncbi:hypothetical protein BRADI_3g30040v3 [Brachypodium distachyon]|uniref:RING-type domain-containing protein n=1 Tax=Brachypodium distachyon TaxID=15368 RepID=A0A0Q3FC97_BRADI|nr:hypothetical protein BRADI_3g30040v3 [Brachypodium distachyon]
MRKAYRDSLKVLEADIQHANTLASEFPREYDGACLQMRLSYSPAAHIFLFLVQWTDCSLAGALGLLRILIYKVYVDGTTTMSTHERKASIKEFYAVVFPSLLQLQRGITDMEDKKQKAVCMERYRRREDDESSSLSDIDAEREEECGICMEMNSKVVLPNCTHAMCLRCYQDWYAQTFSFCPCISCDSILVPCNLLMRPGKRGAIDNVDVGDKFTPEFSVSCYVCCIPY